MIRVCRIHYPLPLPYAGKPDPEILQETIRRLQAEIRALQSQVVLTQCHTSSRQSIESIEQMKIAILYQAQMCFTLPYSLTRIYMDLRSVSYLISTSGCHWERDGSRRNLSHWIIKSADYLQPINMLIILVISIIGSSTVWVAMETKLLTSLLCIFCRNQKTTESVSLKN